MQPERQSQSRESVNKLNEIGAVYAHSCDGIIFSTRQFAEITEATPLFWARRDKRRQLEEWQINCLFF
jgi:hypothetical protein